MQMRTLISMSLKETSLNYGVTRLERLERLKFWAKTIIGILAVFYLCSNPVFGTRFSPPGTVVHSFTQLRNSIPNFVINSIDNNDTATKEVFQVTYPNVSKITYGPSLYHETLISHYFGNSWGSPAIVEYTYPPINFNRVIVTLNTKSSGVQYDRLAHLFFNGIPVWRTSTMEPGGRNVHSYFQKDISEYVDLFKSNGSLRFQLDNIITGRLDGGFQIDLDVDFYYEPEFYDNNDILSLTKSPKIYPVGPVNPNSPLTYFPDTKYRFQLPLLNSNTTRLKLSIFTSGNGDEEFWYTNVLNANVNKYKANGIGLLGHGPIRLITVYYNGDPIANFVPEPVIFTGGFSPPLWSPTVSVSAYDLRSYNLDITGVLSNWKPTDIFEVAVTNGIDDGLIGSNWITSVNLHVWENPQVVNCAGTFHTSSKSDNKVINIGYSDINQIITYTSISNMTSDLTYTLANGSLLDTAISAATVATISNVQVYNNKGYHQMFSVLGSTIKDFTLRQVNQTFAESTDTSYPLVMLMNITFTGPDTMYDINIVNGKKIIVNKNDQTVFYLDDIQNGTSTFTISPQGNHGSGSTTTKYKLKANGVDYYRHVEAESGQVVYNCERFQGEQC